MKVCYTAQVRGDVTALPRLATAIKREGDAIRVDLGNFSGTDPLGDHVVLDVYNQLGFAAALLGPEDLQRGEARVAAMTDRVRFPLLSAGTPLARIGRVVLLCVEAIDQVPIVRADCDFLIVLSRQGFEYDRALAQAWPDVDAIIEGESIFDSPIRIGRVLLVPAPPTSRTVGVLTL